VTADSGCGADQHREPMPGERFLIVNADDFGLSPGVNRGIIATHEHGIVTSASLMVRWAAALEAAAYAKTRPELGVGLHVDLGEWAYQNGEWISLYDVVPLDDHDAVTAEVARQLTCFRRLLGREPTHLDSHQHVHRDPPVLPILRGLAQALGIPLRHDTPGIRFEGGFYGQSGRGDPSPDAITVEALLDIIANLPSGITELCCHPGEDDVVSTYRTERRREVETLCDPRIRSALATGSIRLRSFGHLARSATGSLVGGLDSPDPGETIR
jgi:chitin disaccharide deacetylase